MSRKKNKRKRAKQKSLINPGKEATGTKSKCWESDLLVSTDDKCPHITDRDTPKIIVPYEIWHQIMALTKELDTEWLGYLGGSLLQDGDWKVTGITVPKQEVGCAAVKPIDTIPAEGVVHSHVNMACSFSGTDDSFINENHGFSIVVNKRDDSKGVVRMNLPCGAMSVIDADVVIEYPGCPDISEFLEEAKKNIEEEKTVPLAVRGYGNNVCTPYNKGKKWNRDTAKWETDLDADKDTAKESKALRLRTWNQETCSWDEAKDVDDAIRDAAAAATAADNDIPKLLKARKDDLGVPDFNPKHRKRNYKGWDYYDEDNQCYC